MTSDVRVKFIDVLARQFPVPKIADQDLAAWEGDYVAALSRFSDQVLRDGALKIISEREVRYFPLVSECVKACREVEVDLWRETATPKPKAKAPHPEWSPEACKEADRLISTYHDSRRALREDWAWGLWDFCRTQGRWPNQNEADKVRSRSMALNRDFEAMTAAGTNGLMRQWADMRTTKLAKLAQIIEGAAKEVAA